MSFDNKGFTLIEFLVAIVILMVGLLGLLQTVNYAIVHNTTNALRQEALVLADERMNLEKAKPYALIQAPYLRNFSSSRVVNGGFRMYSVAQNNTALASPTKNIDIQVSWRYKNQRFTHSISSLVSQPQ
ncbi:prepilin-type N-terminal cleavage/methylation domain-containing protein [Geobacter sp. SVR]|uniref:type IV pilus modification PilV family protein n=1 Tax=Geobacter sp. SVR TaxID=2495594 RepID=UPI001EF2B04C|nr:prepilin-type N-terminal cleavage/methylation domain-containing protein [Geobacter sp. SVR]